MIEELRIGGLGVIESSTLELGPGLTVITGETGAGKTMLVTALGLLLGGRGDAGAVRTGARAARIEGVVRAVADLGRAVEEAGGEVEDDRVLLARTVSAEGRSRAFVGGAAVPVSTLASVIEPLVAVHGQSDQHRLLRPQAQREALDRFGGDEVAEPAAAYARLHADLRDTESELTTLTTSARERAREVDLLRFGLDEIEAVAPESGEDVALAAEEARLGHADTLRTAAEQAREALSSEEGRPDALATTAAARTLLDGVRDHDPEAAELADRLAELTYLLSDLAADVASYASRLETDPARLAAVSERRAALTALTRKYGDTIDDVLSWAESAAARLGELDHTDDRIEELRDRRQRPRRRGAAAGGQHGVGAAPAPQGRLGRRAVPGDARAGGGAGRHQPGADLRLRRGRRRRRGQGGDRGGRPAGQAGQVRAGAGGDPPPPGRGVRRPARRRGQVQRRLGDHVGPDRPRGRRPGQGALPDARRRRGVRQRPRPRPRAPRGGASPLIRPDPLPGWGRS
jgi:DNA repair protein RecN (Recombination protein N)